ncbi:MAG: hypothetical protein A2091_03695 [Desulfuromonadales bacterium GWD2_61_12]|nr:MAG: hypothetical protein A2091_03695 [Desulfuromonadales bacterium GWD2_61_12]
MIPGQLGVGLTGIGHARCRKGETAPPGAGEGAGTLAEQPEEGEGRGAESAEEVAPPTPELGQGRQPRRNQLTRAGNELGQGGDEETDGQLRQQADGQTAEEQEAHRHEHARRRLVGLSRRRGARFAEEGDTEEAGKGDESKGAGQAEDPDQQQRRQAAETLGRESRLQEREIEEPFADQPVERRQGGDGETAADKEGTAPRHALEQPAHLVHIAAAGGMEQAAGAEKHQPLEKGMVPAVQQTAGEGEGGEGRLTVAQGIKTETETEEDDADILDGGVGQAAFDVALQRRHGDAVEGPGPAEEHEDETDFRRRRRQQADDPEDAVDPGLDHHSRHQGGDVTRRRRVGIGEPDVEGKESGLDPETGNGESRQEGGRRLGKLRQAGEIGKGQAAAVNAGADKKSEEKHQRQVGEDEVEPGGLAHLGLPVFKGDEEEGADGHDLPRRQKEDGIGGGDDQEQAGDEDIEEEPVGAEGRGARIILEIADGVNGTEEGEKGDGENEKSGQGIE